MQVVTVSCGKGGTTKSTTAAEVAYRFAQEGRRVLVLDLDGQSDVGYRLGIGDDDRPTGTAAEVLAGQISAAEAAMPSPVVPGVDVLVGGRDMEDVAGGLADDSLAAYLPTLADRWDAVVIDAAPSLASATAAAIHAADVLVVPVECGLAAIRKVGETLALAHAGQAVWLVPTRYEANTVMSREAVQLMEVQMPGRVTPPVRRGVAALYAEAAQMPTSAYDPASGVAQDYAAALAVIFPA